MIVTRTPFRISFIGGGSDLEAYYSRSPGAVLSVTIDKFMYLSSHPFFEEDSIRLKYSSIETVTAVDQIRHPIFREAFLKFDGLRGIEVSSNADIPAGTGLGSSSAFTVGLLHNLYAVTGQHINRNRLAREACEIEIDRLEEPIGKQDQYAAAFGGLNVIRFDPSGQVEVERIHLKQKTYERLERSLCLFYLKQQRKTSTILSEQRDNMDSEEHFQAVRDMVGLVDRAHKSLMNGDIGEFGRVIHENWLLKRRLASRITSPAIDELYSRALDNGALGGKLLGAGGGGFLLFCCEPDNQERLRSSLTDLREVRCKLEDEGTKLIYVGDEYDWH